MRDTTTLHGTCVAVEGEGVLILGPPGSGKSDLALRLIDQPGCGLGAGLKSALLVADDQVHVSRKSGKLVASAPPVLAGKLEVRGLGIVDIATAAHVPLVLCVRLTDAATIERLPDLAGSTFEVLGVRLPLVMVDPLQASAPARVRAALGWCHSG